MKNLKGLIFGVANQRSIAWGIARSLHNHGAELAFTYPVDSIKKRIEPLAESLNSNTVLYCDVTDEKSIDDTFEAIEEKWGKLDFVVHAVAFSDKEELKGRYVDTSLNNFLNSMHVSCYSFTAIAQRAIKLMKNGGNLLTLSYYGAVRVIPHYNVMGLCKSALEASVRYLAADLGKDNVRVNAISAGPIKTLAASGIGDFNYILKWNQYNSPLKRNTTIEDVGDAAIYLLSPLSRGTTGVILPVDSGYHVVGMKAVDAPDIEKVAN
ncbi:MAG: enoyl-ACP reductase FabI [Rickettsiaceae bacterium H1]|nr:enoyl-ACP reductase FabI [Rickettsiaceae bacterium H1]